MPTPEWLAADEDDADRFPAPHASAQISTHSPDEGSRVIPDPARVARYAQAIYTEGAYCGECSYESWADCSECRRLCGYYGLTAVFVADGERASLVAEVERLRGELAELHGYLHGILAHLVDGDAETAMLSARAALSHGSDAPPPGALPWEARAVEVAGGLTARTLVAEVERLRVLNKGRLADLKQANLWSWKLLDRAEAAEAKVAKVEAMADAVRALRSRVHASKERGAAYDAWVLTDLLDSALEGHTCTDPNAECWACAVLADAPADALPEELADPQLVADLRATPPSAYSHGVRETVERMKRKQYGDSDAPAEQRAPERTDLPRQPCRRSDKHVGHTHINEGLRGGCGMPEWCPGIAEQRAEVCGHDVGDPPEVCRCLLPRGHSGLHSCKHTERAEGGA